MELTTFTCQKSQHQIFSLSLFCNATRRRTQQCKPTFPLCVCPILKYFSGPVSARNQIFSLTHIYMLEIATPDILLFTFFFVIQDGVEPSTVQTYSSFICLPDLYNNAKFTRGPNTQTSLGDSLL